MCVSMKDTSVSREKKGVFRKHYCVSGEEEACVWEGGEWV